MKKNSTSSKSVPSFRVSESPASSDDFTAATEALMVLGYTKNEACTALDGISPDTTLEDMIRLGLKKLMR